MATFFSNQTIWYWGSTAFPVKGTLSGDVTRSGNTVTLSNMSLALSWPPSAYGSYPVTFTVNGTSTSRTMSANTGTFAVNSTSLTVGTTATSANVSWSSSDGYSGSFTVTFPSGGTSPTGLATQVASRTWNSATMKTSVTSWGTGAGPNRLVIHIGPTYNNETYLRQAEANYSPFTATINNSSTTGIHQAFTMKGCITLYPYIYASNGTIEARSWGSAFYLPPAPLQSVSKASESYAGSNKSNVTISITGGNSTNNNNVTVSTQYRYSTNGGSSWTAWAQAGTGTPWTAKSVTFQVPCNTSVQVEARQVYQSQASEVKSLTFTSIKTPAMLYVPVSGKSKLARKAYIGINGQSEKVLKIYKGVNGQAKLVYTD